MVTFDDLYVLQLAESIADDIWKMAFRWETFVRDVIGKQMIRAADSIGANIAEAFGRYHYGDKLNFLYYARGSVFETKYWLNRAANRDLILPKDHQSYAQRLNDMAKGINGYAGKLRVYRKGVPSALKEPDPVYFVETEIAAETWIFSKEQLAWLLEGSDTRLSTLHHIRQTTAPPIPNPTPNPNPNPNPDPDPDPDPNPDPKP